MQAGIKAGKSVDELKKEIKPESLRSLGGGYAAQLKTNYERAVPVLAGGPHPFEGSFAGNIEHTYARLRAQ